MLQDSPIIERRIATRVAVERAVSLETEEGVLDAVTVNVSTSGMLVATGAELTIWAEVSVDLLGVGLRSARVARRDGDRYGLVFREPLTAEEFVGFTGVAAAEPKVQASAPATKRAARVSPMGFGRDRLKTLKREAAERAAGERAR